MSVPTGYDSARVSFDAPRRTVWIRIVEVSSGFAGAPFTHRLDVHLGSKVPTRENREDRGNDAGPRFYAITGAKYVSN